MDDRSPRVLVASTLPFTLAGRHFIQHTLDPVLRTNGLQPLFPRGPDRGTAVQRDGQAPWEYVPQSATEAAATHLGDVYLHALNQCDSVLALLDGPDVESGVAAAVGYAATRVPIIGWRSDSRRSGEPVSHLVNVFLEHLIRLSGGVLTTDLDVAIRSLTQARRRI